VKRLFDVCDNNCERLTRLVDAILDLEKLASGELRFNFRDEPSRGSRARRSKRTRCWRASWT
jgi:hypothetical protein